MTFRATTQTTILAASCGFSLLAAMAAPAAAQTEAQFHAGTMGAPHNTGTRKVLATGLEFRDVRLRGSRYSLSQRIFGNSGKTAKRHLEAMSFRRASLVPAHGISFYGPYSVPDDPDTRADESLHRHSIFKGNRAEPILFMGIAASNGRFLTAIHGGGSRLETGGQTSVRDASRTPWETLALVDLNGGRLNHGDRVGFKTAEGFWLRQAGSYIRADAPLAMAGVYFRIFKYGGSSTINDGDRFVLKAANGRYVRAEGRSTTATGWYPSTTGVFTLQRTSMDSIRMSKLIVNETRRRYGASFRGMDRNRNNVLEWHECTVAMYLADTGPDICAANRSFSTRYVPGESGMRIAASLIFLGAETNAATITHELVHDYGATDMYGARSINFQVSLMGPTCVPSLDWSVHLDPWHKMRLGWIRPRIINIQGKNCTEIVRAVTSSQELYHHRPLILYDPARYNLSTRSGEFFMVESRKRSTGMFDESLTTEGLALWQIKTDRSGWLLATPAVTGQGMDSSCNHLSPGNVRGGDQLYRESHGVIVPRYLDGTAAGFRLRVSNPLSSLPGYAVVEISRDGRMRPVVRGAYGARTPGSTLTIYGELSPTQAANTGVYLGGRRLTVTSRSTSLRVMIPSTMPRGTHWLLVRQYGRYSTPIRVTVR